MPFYSRLAHSEPRNSLKQLGRLSDKIRKIDDNPHPPYQALCILIDCPIFGELQLVLQYSDIHIRVVISPERCLSKTNLNKIQEIERMKLTMPVSISYSIVPKLHQSTS
jgi:hypothetical protein